MIANTGAFDLVFILRYFREKSNCVKTRNTINQDDEEKTAQMSGNDARMWRLCFIIISRTLRHKV